VVPVISRGVPPAAIHIGAAHSAGHNFELFMIPAGRTPGKTVGTRVGFGLIFLASTNRRSAIRRQSLRLRGGSKAAAFKCRGVRRSGTSAGVRSAAFVDRTKHWDCRSRLPIISKTGSPGAELTYNRQFSRRTVGDDFEYDRQL
jgi:hypothetical protein